MNRVITTLIHLYTFLFLDECIKFYALVNKKASASGGRSPRPHDSTPQKIQFPKSMGLENNCLSFTRFCLDEYSESFFSSVMVLVDDKIALFNTCRSLARDTPADQTLRLV